MDNPRLPHLFVAVPLLNENERVGRLISCIQNQDYKDFTLYFCVNQPDEWWHVSGKREICLQNKESLDILRKTLGSHAVIIDRSSPGLGWRGRRHGVGWARKTVMDAIEHQAEEKDIILSMDADVTFSEHYFSSIASNFSNHPEAVALAVPYFHLPPEDPAAYRAILRYEIYMRMYSLNLWRIGSPYTFTALGSAMACPVFAYRAIGGMTPKMSGEDFYFLQKLRKYGKMIFWNPEKIYPEARFSDRVYFGTGPAMIRGNEGDWSSYPVYPYRFFDEIKTTTDLFPDFFEKTQFTGVVKFLQEQFLEEDPFQPIRRNAREKNQFVRACYEKFDGLRTLQYLKTRDKEEPSSWEKNLIDFLDKFFPDEWENLRKKLSSPFDFNLSSLSNLEMIRTFLTEKEDICQINSLPSLPGQQLPGVLWRNEP
ncbi:MAG: hypothetical protein Q8867_07625 [Bacteroidota bacterium]|nr:hypothetical protein [Bacteroidota bacterium]